MQKSDILITELRRVLRDNHIKIKEFSQQIGMTQQIVYRWFNGTARPKDKTRIRILQAITLFRTGKFIEDPEIEIKSGFQGTLENNILDKSIFEKLKHQLTPEQKTWLLETGDFLVYHKRLRELNEEYEGKKAADERS